MHHSDYYFQPFRNVLMQLDKFVKAHKGEILFLDIDFDKNDLGLEQEIMSVLIHTLGESRLATAHVKPSTGGYNTNLTWGELKQANTPFVVIWRRKGNLPQWAAFADDMRSDDYDNFNEKSPEEILAFLTRKLENWKREKLFLTQLINTPRWSPLNPPAEKDYEARVLYNRWIAGHPQGSNLGIVKMDFINAACKREAIDHIIRLNKFTSSPELPPLTNPIYYTDKIRMKTAENQYVCLQVVEHPDLCKLALVDVPNEDCNFLIRDYDYDPRKPFPYSGNLDGTTPLALFVQPHSTLVHINRSFAILLKPQY